MKKLVYLFITIFIAGHVKAQDPQFSQFYAAPMYHNPAFTGSAYAPRIIGNYRNQWPSLGANYVTNMVSVDTYLDKYNSGIGIMFLNDKLGGRLENTEFSGFYSYQMNLYENHSIRFGVQGTYSRRGFDALGLTFGDQFNSGGFTGNATSDPIGLSEINPISFVDFSSGVLYYNPKAYLGLSVNHLTQPQTNFLAGSQEVLARKITVNGGLNIPLANAYSGTGSMDKEISFSPAFLFKQQGKFSQLDLGAYLTYSPLTFGAWYRGIPIKKSGTTRSNHDALVFLAGIRFDSFSLGYSYDVTISGLGASSGGSHELSFAYQFEAFESERNPNIRRRKKELSCPRF